MTDEEKPRLIVVAGPNGSGKTRSLSNINPWAREIAQRLLLVSAGDAPSFQG